MSNSQIYNVFLDIPSAPKLFSFKEDPILRPGIGDVITERLTFRQFKILRDEFNKGDDGFTRITHDNDIRITEDGDTRVTSDPFDIDPNTVTHNYFVTPVNNSNRISSWSTAGFANDQTLRQLFR